MMARAEDNIKKRINRVKRHSITVARAGITVALLLRELFGFAEINPRSNGV